MADETIEQLQARIAKLERDKFRLLKFVKLYEGEGKYTPSWGILSMCDYCHTVIDAGEDYTEEQWEECDPAEIEYDPESGNLCCADCRKLPEDRRPNVIPPWQSDFDRFIETEFEEFMERERD